MQSHQRAKVVRCFAGNKHPSAGDALKMPLTGVERDAKGVVEMSVSDEDVRHADG